MKRLIGVFLVVFIAACSTPPPKFYKAAKFTGIGGDYARIDYDLRVSGVPRPAPPTAFNLPERAQAALITAYASDTKAEAKLPQRLAEPIKIDSPTPLFDKSHVVFKRRFTFTIIAEKFHPADRV